VQNSICAEHRSCYELNTAKSTRAEQLKTIGTSWAHVQDKCTTNTGRKQVTKGQHFTEFMT